MNTPTYKQILLLRGKMEKRIELLQRVLKMLPDCKADYDGRNVDLLKMAVEDAEFALGEFEYSLGGKEE